MNKENLLILLPVYNDWRSLQKLLTELNTKFKNSKFIVKILIVDDASKEKLKFKFLNLKYINKIKILRLKTNSGNQKAILFGLKYINQTNYNGIISVMDADGEDDPKKLELLIKKLKENKNNFIVAARRKRTENFTLKSLNFFRLIITFVFTGKYINFGNYSCFYSKNLKKIINNKSIFLAYCATLQKYNIIKIYINKKKRYYDKSKANFYFLISHSINIISAFFIQFLIRSILLLIFVIFTMQKNFLIFNIIIVTILTMNVLIILNYLKKQYINY